MISSTKTDKQRALVISIIALTLTAIATAGRLISLLFFYDRIGYYATGAFLPVLSNVIYAVSVVFFVAAAILLPKSVKSIPSPSKSVGYVALLPAIASAVYLVSSLPDLLGGANILALVSSLLSIASAAFFAIIAFSSRRTSLTAILGACVVLWLALFWMHFYRDFTVPMNSPNKLFFSFGCIGSVFFIVSELRALFGISKPRLYYFSTFCAILSLAVSSIPSLIANAKDIFASYSVLSEDIFFLSLLVYAVARLIYIPRAEQEETVTETPDEQADAPAETPDENGTAE